MFTGIVEEVGQVVSLANGRLTVAAREVLRGLKPGDSIDVNGACLTVTAFDDRSFNVDVMEETLSRTSLGTLQPGSRVNLETALTLQKPLGGHLVQGHVDGTGKLESIEHRADSTIVSISAPPEIMRYVVEKGFIAVDGVSLTVVSRRQGSFSVSLVGFTAGHTSLAELAEGSTVNLEADIIAKYVEQMGCKREEAISLDFLKEHGFLNK